MLVLARGVGQSVVLDGRITVTVLATRGGLVRIGIDAPAEIGVRRGELGPADPPGPGWRGPAAHLRRPPPGDPVPRAVTDSRGPGGSEPLKSYDSVTISTESVSHSRFLDGFPVRVRAAHRGAAGRP